MARFLQVAGVLGLLAWTGLGAAAWMLVKDRLQITIADGAEAVRAADDPVALLSGQVENLQTDLSALTDGLNTSLQGLADYVTEDGATRSETLRKELAQQIAGLQQMVDQQRAMSRGDLQRLESSVAAVRSALDELPRPGMTGLVASGGSEGIGAVAGSAGTEPATTDPQPLVADGGTDPSTAPQAETETAAGSGTAHETGESAAEQQSGATSEVADGEPVKPKKSFLAISLPSKSFSFDGSQAWEVIPSLSRVGFDCKSTLHDFTGVTSKVDGRFTANLAKPDAGIEGTVTADARTLKTGLDGRDDAMGEHLLITEHPAIEFKPTQLAATSIDADKRRVEGTVTGTMTIRGVTKELSMPVVLEVDKSLRLGIEGQTKLLMSEFGVPVPSQLGMINVQDEVQVWINLKLRAKAKESK